jgi:hypothetical protein
MVEATVADAVPVAPVVTLVDESVPPVVEMEIGTPGIGFPYASRTVTPTLAAVPSATTDEPAPETVDDPMSGADGWTVMVAAWRRGSPATEAVIVREPATLPATRADVIPDVFVRSVVPVVSPAIDDDRETAAPGTAFPYASTSVTVTVDPVPPATMLVGLAATVESASDTFAGATANTALVPCAAPLLARRT